MRRRMGMTGFVVLVCMTVAQVSPGGTAPTPEGSEGARGTRYDGKTLLRGLMVGTGPVAELIPEVWDSRSLSSDAAALGDRLIERLCGEDPTFCKDFALAIQSGNHLRVERALLEATRRVDTAARIETGGDLDNTDFTGPGPQGLWGIFRMFDFRIVKVSTRSEGLERDTQIDIITTRLDSASTR